MIVIGRAFHSGQRLVCRHRGQDVAAARQLDAETARVHVLQLGQRCRAGPDHPDDLAARLVLQRIEQALRRRCEVGGGGRRYSSAAIVAPVLASAALKAATPSRPNALSCAERRDRHTLLSDRHRIRDRVLRGVAAGAEDVAVPLVAGDVVGHRRLHDQDLLALLGDGQHRERGGRRRRTDRNVDLVVLVGFGERVLATSGLPWSSLTMMTILRPSIAMVPLVAYSKPIAGRFRSAWRRPRAGQSCRGSMRFSGLGPWRGRRARRQGPPSIENNAHVFPPVKSSGSSSKAQRTERNGLFPARGPNPIRERSSARVRRLTEPAPVRPSARTHAPSSRASPKNQALTTTWPSPRSPANATAIRMPLVDIALASTVVRSLLETIFAARKKRSKSSGYRQSHLR